MPERNHVPPDLSATFGRRMFRYRVHSDGQPNERRNATNGHRGGDSNAGTSQNYGEHPHALPRKPLVCQREYLAQTT